MKTKNILLALTSLCCAGCTCTQLSLEDFEKDIPSGLVRQYEAGSGYFVDEGETFLPFLFWANSYVSKSDQYFSAYKDQNIAIWAYDSVKFSSFDRQGELLEHYRSNSTLTPLTYSSSTSAVKNDGIIHRGHSWSFASFGFEQKVSGDKYISVLWIPIKIHGEPTPKASFKFDPKVRKKAAQIALRNNKIQKQNHRTHSITASGGSE